MLGNGLQLRPRRRPSSLYDPDYESHLPLPPSTRDLGQSSRGQSLPSMPPNSYPPPEFRRAASKRRGVPRAESYPRGRDGQSGAVGYSRSVGRGIDSHGGGFKTRGSLARREQWLSSLQTADGGQGDLAYPDDQGRLGGGGGPCLLYQPQPQNEPLAERLMRDIEALEAENRHLRERNDAMQSTRDAREDLLARQETDMAIGNHFDGILGQIRSWTSEYCQEAKRTMDVDGIAPELTALIRTVVPGVQTLQDLPRLLPQGRVRLRRRFIQGWIAFNMVDMVDNMFRSLPAPTYIKRSGLDVWIPAGPREAVKGLEMTFLNSGHVVPPSVFHEWRALTFTLLSKTFPPSFPFKDTVEGLDTTIRRTMEVIKPLLILGVDLTEPQRHLRDNVFLPAIELSRVLRRQRASWGLRFPHTVGASQHDKSGFVEFRPDEMEDIDDCREDESEDETAPLRAINIVVSPGLCKRGNQDGERYDVEYHFRKAQVSGTEIVPQDAR